MYVAREILYKNFFKTYKNVNFKTCLRNVVPEISAKIPSQIGNDFTIYIRKHRHCILPTCFCIFPLIVIFYALFLLKSGVKFLETPRTKCYHHITVSLLFFGPSLRAGRKTFVESVAVSRHIKFHRWRHEALFFAFFLHRETEDSQWEARRMKHEPNEWNLCLLHHETRYWWSCKAHNSARNVLLSQWLINKNVAATVHAD